jgi:L-asparaginase type II
MRIVVVVIMLALTSVGFAADKPQVVILATGGTIAGSGNTSTSATYTAAKVPVDQLLNAVPEIHELAEVRGEQVTQIASQAMTTEVWQQLARRVNHHLQQPEVSGVVITHGTDTMEETAYFLDLVIHSDKPVILVGSMRPPTSLSADGSLNLYNAVAVAASNEGKKYGVMIAMNDSLYAARDVTKSNTTAVDTFQSPRKGPLARVEYGKINFYQAPKTNNPSPFTLEDINQLPVVDIVYGYANASPVPVNALVTSGSRGIVHAGVGNGNLFPTVEQALIAARKQGVFVVRASRVGSGEVIRNAEVDDDKWDFVVSNDLSPQKARIVLMLGIAKGLTTEQLQILFNSL